VSGHYGSAPSDGSDQEKSELKNLPGPVAFAAMGTTLASCLAVGVLLGLYIDHLWNVAPVGLLIGIALGTVAAVASVVKLVRRYL
jgi:F0F1-type ATP synthase assembly protein I